MLQLIADTLVMDPRLQAAEDRLKDLEERVHSVEHTASKGSGDDNHIREYQAVVLERLKSIRQTMLEEVGDIDAVRKERDTAVSLAARQKTEIDQLNYRVNHLIKALNEAQAK